MDLKKIIEILESARYNTTKVAVVGTVLTPVIKSQIETAIKMLDPNWQLTE